MMKLTQPCFIILIQSSCYISSCLHSPFTRTQFAYKYSNYVTTGWGMWQYLCDTSCFQAYHISRHYIERREDVVREQGRRGGKEGTVFLTHSAVVLWRLSAVKVQDRHFLSAEWEPKSLWSTVCSSTTASKARISLAMINAMISKLSTQIALLLHLQWLKSPHPDYVDTSCRKKNKE